MNVHTDIREEGFRPLGDLLGGLAADVSGLFGKQIELARAEASEKVSSMMGGVIWLMAAAVVGIGAVVVLFAAIVTALAAYFVSQHMEATMANALASAIVFVVAALIAWALVARGRAVLSASNMKLERTMHTLADNATAVRGRF